MDTRTVPQTTPNAPALGWTVLGVYKKFILSFISFSNQILFPKKMTVIPLTS